MRRSKFTYPLALLLLVGCGGDDGKSGSGDEHAHHHGHGASQAPAGPADRTVAVRGKAVSYDPAKITAKAGETIAVAFTADDTEHDFVIDELGVHAHANKGATTTATLKATKAGTYRYYCSVAGHLQAGMKGELVVTG